MGTWRGKGSEKVTHAVLQVRMAARERHLADLAAAEAFDETGFSALRGLSLLKPLSARMQTLSPFRSSKSTRCALGAPPTDNSSLLFESKLDEHTMYSHGSATGATRAPHPNGRDASAAAHANLLDC